MILPTDPLRVQTSDPVHDGLAAMQQTIADIRARLDALPHRGAEPGRRGVRALVEDHPVAAAAIVVLALAVVVLGLYLLLRRKR
jgi:hypothetical protein